MNTYTYSQARQNLALILEKAKSEGSVLIKRKDGIVFELKQIKNDKSPLDVEGIDIEITKNEILDTIKEIRQKEN